MKKKQRKANDPKEMRVVEGNDTHLMLRGYVRSDNDPFLTTATDVAAYIINNGVKGNVVIMNQSDEPFIITDGFCKFMCLDSKYAEEQLIPALKKVLMSQLKQHDKQSQ